MFSLRSNWRRPLLIGGLMLIVVAGAATVSVTGSIECDAVPPTMSDTRSSSMQVAHLDAPDRRVINGHVLQDRLFMGIAQQLSSAQYFEDSIESQSFDAHLAAVSLTVPDITGSGEIGISAQTAVGDLSAAVNALHWAGDDAPTIIYHHGGGEVPYTETISQVFPSGTLDDVNLFVVRSPYHQEGGDQNVVQGASHLANYLAMMAVAVDITEQLSQRYDPVLVAGYSLGGFVTNRHHLAYDSADAYVPFMAGTAHAEIFLTTYPAAASARDQPQQLRQQLNFTDAWRQTTHPNVYPVLGMYDCLNALNIQGASYGETPVSIWAVSHISGLSAHQRLRETMLRHLADATP